MSPSGLHLGHAKVVLIDARGEEHIIDPAGYLTDQIFQMKADSINQTS